MGELVISIGIIGAMDIEIEALKEAMELEETRVISGISFYFGSLGGVCCVLAKSGAGKVNSSVCAQTMIMEFNPSAIINTGVAGGIDIEIGSMVLASGCVQHDYDTTAIGEPPAELVVLGRPIREFPCDPKLSELLERAAKGIYGNVYSGVIATGDKFVGGRAQGLELKEKFNAIACEMEGGSIAQVCYMNGLPVAVIRSISDNGDEGAKQDFAEFAKSAAAQSQSLLTKAMPELYAQLQCR